MGKLFPNAYCVNTSIFLVQLESLLSRLWQTVPQGGLSLRGVSSGYSGPFITPVVFGTGLCTVCGHWYKV